MTTVFRRLEKKYLITKEDYDLLVKLITPFMRKDYYCLNGNYLIYNIYFDSDKNTLIRHSIQKPYFKEKIRMRSYSLNGDETPTFLEIKRKVGKIVSKRRIVAPFRELLLFLQQGTFPKCLSYKEQQIASELLVIASHYECYPKVFLSYEREAYYDKTTDDLRITFDSNVRYRENNLSFLSKEGNPILPEGFFILEIKFLNAMPLWLTQALSSLRIYPKSVSKYAMVYKNLLD